MTVTTIDDTSTQGASTSLGVSAGAGLIHYVLLTRDDLGRSVVDTRVIDVDRSDGLDDAGRVNAGIDFMLGAARESGLRVGPIGVATRSGAQRRSIRSEGTGQRRQIQLVGDDEAVVDYLGAMGSIERFSSVVIVDCGDTGMSMYVAEPATGRISQHERSTVLSGRALDRAIAKNVAAQDPTVSGAYGSRSDRGVLLSACRTAKEELAQVDSTSTVSAVPLADGVNRVELTVDMVTSAVEDMAVGARDVLARYISVVTARGVVPEALVFVGGLANFAGIRALADGHPDLEAVHPPTPELAAAVGAAQLAGERSGGVSRLAFIGGGRSRNWLAPVPIAVVGALIVAALTTVFAVSASFAGREAPLVPTTSDRTTGESTVFPTVQTPTTTAAAPPIDTEAPVQTEQTYPQPEQRWDDAPGWATTELPQSVAPSTTTRTLVPYPIPTIPNWPSGFGPSPTIPPSLMPGAAPSATPGTPTPSSAPAEVETQDEPQGDEPATPSSEVPTTAPAQ